MGGTIIFCAAFACYFGYLSVACGEGAVDRVMCGGGPMADGSKSTKLGRGANALPLGWGLAMSSPVKLSRLQTYSRLIETYVAPQRGR